MSVIDENGINLDLLYANIRQGENYGDNIPLIRYAIVSLNYDAVAYLYSCVDDIVITSLKEYQDIDEYKLVWRLLNDGYFTLVLDNSISADKIFTTPLDILEHRLVQLEFPV